MSRVIVDYSRAAAEGGHRRRRSRVSPFRVAVAALLLLAILGAAAYGGRAVVRAIRNRPTAASHALSADQLSGLHQVAPNTRDSPDMRPAAGQPDVLVSPSPVILSTALLPVPYTVQAPFNNWKQFENACEEAALLMYHDFLEGDSRTQIPPAEADQKLRALEAWQVTNWGAEKDLTLDRTGQLANQYYGYQYKVLPATRESIMEQISAGHPVIIPVMTHSLQNKNYGPQTVYHEVLLKGYTDAGVVSNDAGVKEGKDWFYSWSIIFAAIDAQTPKMGQGRVILILYH